MPRNLVNHEAELAAERALLAAATLLRNTAQKRPIQAKRHTAAMLRELPTIAQALPPDVVARLKTRMGELSIAYERGDSLAAKEANRGIEASLSTLCH
jgi:hypothetical protein